MINDYHDANFDKLHPVKRKRPIASGKIKKSSALIISGICYVFSLIAAYFSGIVVVLIINLYIILNLSYSLGLKNVPILELIIVSFGFILRLYSGSIPTETPLTLWILLLTFSLAMLLVSAKRYHYLKLFNLKNHLLRPVLLSYNNQIMNIIVLSSAISVFGIYLFWSLFSQSFQRKEPDWLFVSGVFVAIGILRYLWIVYKDENSGFPVEVFYTDTIIKLTVVGWLSLMIFYFYG